MLLNVQRNLFISIALNDFVTAIANNSHENLTLFYFSTKKGHVIQPDTWSYVI